MIPELPKRPSVSHKGDYGRALLIGGARGMAGAVSLAGLACLKAGAGLVKIAAPIDSQPIVASFNPCYMTIPLVQDDDGRITLDAKSELEELWGQSTAIGLGPGLGQSSELIEFVSWAYSRVSAPMVVDADALNCLAQNPKILTKPGGPRILTPHQGELRRLLDDNVSTPEELLHRAESLAREAGIILVVKGHRSIITTGVERAQNTTGNSGMATGGSGDVLTGIIVALLCQGIAPFNAAKLGCLMHGLAGDKAVKRIGKISLMATDIIDYLPNAIRSISRKNDLERVEREKPDV